MAKTQKQPTQNQQKHARNLTQSQHNPNPPPTHAPQRTNPPNTTRASQHSTTPAYVVYSTTMLQLQSKQRRSRVAAAAAAQQTQQSLCQHQHTTTTQPTTSQPANVSHATSAWPWRRSSRSDEPRFVYLFVFCSFHLLCFLCCEWTIEGTNYWMNSIINQSLSRSRLLRQRRNGRDSLSVDDSTVTSTGSLLSIAK